MTGDSTAATVPTRFGPENEPVTDFQAVVEALADPDCRCLLRAVGSTALTANECSDACDLPLSTTYRKLELLAEAGFVVERLRIRRDGKHANQYRRRVESVHIEVPADGGFEIDVETDGEVDPADVSYPPIPR